MTTAAAIAELLARDELARLGLRECERGMNVASLTMMWLPTAERIVAMKQPRFSGSSEHIVTQARQAITTALCNTQDVYSPQAQDRITDILRDVVVAARDAARLQGEEQARVIAAAGCVA